MSKNWDNIAAYMDKFRGSLKSFAARKFPKLTLADSEDLVQDVSLELLNHPTEIENVEALSKHITTNRAIDELRKRRRQGLENIDAGALPANESKPDIMASYIRKEGRDHLLTALKKLRPVYRRIVQARYFAGKTLADIAEGEKMPESTIRYYLDEAQQSLASILRLVEISGRVADESEKPLPTSRVVIRGPESRETETDKHGAFSLKFESKGKYSVTVSQSGYITYSQSVHLNRDILLPSIKLCRLKPAAFEATKEGA